jgi:hypothetical protein
MRGIWYLVGVGSMVLVFTEPEKSVEAMIDMTVGFSHARKLLCSQALEKNLPHLILSVIYVRSVRHDLSGMRQIQICDGRHAF